MPLSKHSLNRPDRPVSLRLSLIELGLLLLSAGSGLVYLIAKWVDAP